MSPDIDPKKFEWERKPVARQFTPYNLGNITVERGHEIIVVGNILDDDTNNAVQNVKLRYCVRRAGKQWWCGVHVSINGLEGWESDPNFALIYYNINPIARRLANASKAPFPFHDVRLHRNTNEWIQIGLTDGPTPTDFMWGISEARPEFHLPYTRAGEVAITQSFEITAWNLAGMGQRYPDPDVRVRCYVREGDEKWWCDVHLAWGVTAGMPYPNPQLFLHNKDRIAASFEKATGIPFPTNDVRLHIQGHDQDLWVQIGT